jgi:pimeloyl-ACP methyl ester carboxylesterase
VTHDPLLYDAAEVAQADTLVILIPGALASVAIFGPAADWRGPGTAPVFYRFPGMDGLPLDRDLSIDGAAAAIAAFLDRHPGKRLRLVGYSTGAAIALTLATRMPHADRADRDLRIAAISPAVPRAGGLATRLATTADIAAAALRARSLSPRPVWREYVRTLLFGRPGLADPVTAARSRALVTELAGRIATPDARLARAHTRDIRRWRPPAQPGAWPDPDLAARTTIHTGRDDPVFAVRQTLGLARALGGAAKPARVLAWPGQGHLLLLTAPEVLPAIRDGFRDTAPRAPGP